KGDQFSGFKKKAPPLITAKITPTLIITMRLLARCDSLIPTYTNAVTKTVISPAGKSKITGTPQILRANSYSLMPLSSIPSKFSTPTPNIFWCASKAYAGAIVIHIGIITPKPSNIDTKYWDHEIATTMLETAYSNTKAQPIIQANNSPNATYAYV